MKYTVVIGSLDISEFEGRVEDHLKRGWMLVGGISVVHANTTRYYQAMRRKS